MPLAAKKGQSGRKTWKIIMTIEHDENQVTRVVTICLKCTYRRRPFAETEECHEC